MTYYSIEGPKPRFSAFTPETLHLNTNNRIVEIICYCLMPNHFHLLLKQVREKGISEFMSKISNSYTKYFNTKGKRTGPLLQGDFKSVHIGSTEQLIHTHRYIHINPKEGFLVKNLQDYKWSSYLEYLNLESDPICNKKTIFEQFQSVNSYKEFISDHLGYVKNLEGIKHLALDIE